ncbi:FAD-dependent 5-carboxymethylaminomethyl-2-thiouridine(34) oxidoreductase MnmC [Alphaproteobacteria bacterium]|nr:FAD-dependent 5-carboxymethylaminomethyl-2-thiouridine(34) oxidoreductase MnmC [Alphaproteobacteria bacterium]
MKANSYNPIEYFRPRRRSNITKKPLDIDPNITFNFDGRPFSSRYNSFYHELRPLEAAKDIFFSNLFIKSFEGQTDFSVIGELGFGTGLNFALACNYWKKRNDCNSKLHYVAIEPYPLEAHQVDRFLSGFSVLDTERRELVSGYPKPHVGFHRVWSTDNKIALTLVVGPVDEVLAEVEAEVDLWFLNGFPLRVNPEMWSQTVCLELARLSKPGTDLISICDDEEIQHRLTMQGFQMEKRNGLCGKSGVLEGKFIGKSEVRYLAPWYRPPPPVQSQGTIGIIGAGLAGCAMAEALARRGKRTLLFDQQDDVAQRGSGIEAGLIAPELGLNASNMNRFYDRAYRMALSSIEDSKIRWNSRGVMELLQKDEARRRVQHMKDGASLWHGAAQLMSPSESSSQLGIKVYSHGIWFPQGGALNPKGYAQYMSQKAEYFLGATVHEFAYRDDGWWLYGGSGQRIATVDTLVIAAAQHSKSFKLISFLPLSSLLGQISFIPKNENSYKLKASIISNSYLMPNIDGFHVVGSTYSRDGFDENQWPQPVTVEGHKKNYDNLDRELRSLFSDYQFHQWLGYSAIRCATPDRLPVVGPVPEAKKFKRDFARLSHGPRGKFPSGVAYQPNLFVLAGLGSRGIMTSALSAEVLTSQMLGEPWPIERTVATALSPSRFLARGIQNSLLKKI